VAIDIASDPALIATYPITVLAKTANPTAAQAFVEFVLSDAGQKTLAGFGFLPK
jgi:molybdate transport system substrate-binding protein